MSRQLLCPGSLDHLLVIDSVKKTLEDENLSFMTRSNYQRILEYLQKGYDDQQDDSYDIEDPNIRSFGR